MKILVNPAETILWNDLDFGAVCEFRSSENDTFIGMKVDSSLGEEFLLDLEDSKIYTDCKNYKIIRVFESVNLILE